jgi:hypothetical protein
MAAQQKSVSFDAVEIIQLKYCLGDNPCVTRGSVPISIDWDVQSKTTLPLDYFETIRPSKQPQVRRFSARTREKILLRMGYTTEEIRSAILEAMTTKRERAYTLQQLHELGAF